MRHGRRLLAAALTAALCSVFLTACSDGGPRDSAPDYSADRLIPDSTTGETGSWGEGTINTQGQGSQPTVSDETGNGSSSATPPGPNVSGSTAPITPTGPTAPVTPDPPVQEEVKYRMIDLDFEPFYTGNSSNFTRAMNAAVTQAKALYMAEKQTAKDSFKIRINIKKGNYTLNSPITISDAENIEINGNGSQIVNKRFSGIINLNRCKNVSISNMSFDYDPLPYTQGVIQEIKDGGRTIVMKPDAGYPTQVAKLGNAGIMNVFDRSTKAPKAGSRQFIRVDAAADGAGGVITLSLGWSCTKDVGDGEIPAAVGDVMLFRPTVGDVSFRLVGCAGTSFTDVNLYSSPAMGIFEESGEGGTRLTRVNIIPGPKPAGATQERLNSTNRDASHFYGVKKGPTVTSCKVYNSGDDCINVHNFYYFVVKKVGSGKYYLSPKWDTGMAEGDSVEIVDPDLFTLKATAKITAFAKLNKPELRNEIQSVWTGAGRSETTEPTMVYEVTFDKDPDLVKGDAVTSMTWHGKDTVVRDSEFHGGGRVVVKGPNAFVENCKFSYTILNGIFVGSDIGYWGESHFARRTVIRNNTFDHCAVTANALFDRELSAAIFVGLTPPGNWGFYETYMNQDVIIENNTITNSYQYAITLLYAEGAKVSGNKIDQAFIRGAYQVGANYQVKPNSGIFVGCVRNSFITGNTVSGKGCVTQAVGTYGACKDNTISSNSFHKK